MKVGNMKNKTLISAFAVVILILILIGGVYMAHSKVFVVCEDMCMEEGMTKEQIENTINKFAVLTGTIKGTGGGSVDVDYPSGFTKDNCIVIGQMINNFGGSSFVSGAGYSSSINPIVRLKNDKVGITINTDSTSEITYGYRVMLMKIN